MDRQLFHNPARVRDLKGLCRIADSKVQRDDHEQGGLEGGLDIHFGLNQTLVHDYLTNV